MDSVIVTGASRGLGLAVATTLAAAGYRIIAVSRSDSDGLRAARAAAASGPGSIEFRACDLSQLEQLGEFVRGLRRDIGAPYGLVNNAGLGTSGLLANTRDQDIEQLVRLNTIAPIVLSKYVVRAMMRSARGRIVNVASIVAATGYSGLAAYSATKASLVGFTRSLAREVGQLGITVNAIAPGFIETDMTSELDERQRAKIAGRSALRRMPEPIDVARAVEFLLSEGGRNITGTVLTVDAGNTA